MDFDWWAVIQVFGTIGIWVVIIWFTSITKTLKSMTSSMRDVFDSVKISTDCFASVQRTSERLFDPEVIERVVNARVADASSESQSKYDQLVVRLKDADITAESLRNEKDEIQSTLQRQLAEISGRAKELHEINHANIMSLGLFIALATAVMGDEQSDQVKAATKDKTGPNPILDQLIATAQKVTRDFLASREKRTE